MITKSFMFPWMMGGFAFGFILLLLWSIVWKGLALWYSAERKQKGWFVALLLLNTAGILEIIYLFAVVKVHREWKKHCASHHPHHQHHNAPKEQEAEVVADDSSAGTI